MEIKPKEVSFFVITPNLLTVFGITNDLIPAPRYRSLTLCYCLLLIEDQY